MILSITQSNTIPPATQFITVPSLSELCVESLLSNELDNGLKEGTLTLINENMLRAIWRNLNTKVPKNALGLQTAMSDIENECDPASIGSSLESKTPVFLRRLAKEFSSQFQEAGVTLNSRIPCSWSEYARIQDILERKWADETLLTIWGEAGCGLSEALLKMGAIRKRSLAKGPQEIRTWLRRSRHEVYLNRVMTIDLSKLNVKVCPIEINRFQALETLNLCSNGLHSFSCDLRPCRHLKLLLLFNNKIQLFMPNLSCNSELECIELSKNRLPSFSADLRACVNLKLVNLSYNQIVDFSSDLRSSNKLETLNLVFNQLQKFPYNLLPDKKPKHVFLSRNPIPNPSTPPGFRRTVRKLLAPSLQQTEACNAPKSQRANLLAPPPQQTEAHTSPKSQRSQGAS